MPSIIQALLALSSLLSTAHSLPHRSSNPIPSIPLNQISNSGVAPFPYPTTALKYIALQIGTQNYTCNATTGTYTANGALARIFDATVYLTNHPTQVSSLSRTYLDLYTAQPCSRWPSTRVPADDCCEDLTNLASLHPLPVLGEHYFSATETPTFDLYAAPGHPYLSAKKLGDVPAPSAADVDWLYLVGNGSPQNTIINSVYRIKTAGGVAPGSCTGNGWLEVPYAAEYWYYL
ncbi:hypothetical protein LTR62_008071 [Meristemomyces frigidus]|uniref:Malate dehydrogenase n=1 Tax=Meristemomyces frigidus TaxID=1508187 RepID=A0AAN7TE05_9PEZI|nr:hypothetical protein LTR62_008071 [Meristemomyces frigidus]